MNEIIKFNNKLEYWIIFSKYNLFLIDMNYDLWIKFDDYNKLIKNNINIYFNLDNYYEYFENYEILRNMKYEFRNENRRFIIYEK